jgi:hypothetical protein
LLSALSQEIPTSFGGLAPTLRINLENSYGGTSMTITMILSLLVCIAGLGLVATGMALPLLLLPDEPGGSSDSQPIHRRFPGTVATLRA